MEEQIARPPLRAPDEDGQTLIVPAWERLPATVDENRRSRLEYDYDFQGRSLLDLSEAGRANLLAAATEYTAQYRDVLIASDAHSAILLAGHQPQLFHPGVWFKNFALGRLAAASDGVGINLLIDSDDVRSTAIRVPVGNIDHAKMDSIAFDRLSESIPFEEKVIEDRAMFESFGARVADRLRPLVPDPMIGAFWPIACELSGQLPNLGASLAAARHRLEGDWGNSTLELPASAVCRMPEFHWFIAHLLAYLPRFSDAYNWALAEYRTSHRLRGRAHPMPNLVEEHGWLEAPLWVWSAESPRRCRLFVRCRRDGIELTDRAGWRAELALSADGDAGRAAEQFAALDAQGIRIRSRALITTLFSRLVLGDLFIHGIGGAKYDAVTDAIVRRFFGFEPPQIAAISATLRLPVDVPEVDAGEEARLRHAIRELSYHPEAYLPRLDRLTEYDRRTVQESVAKKRRSVATPKTFENAGARHRAIVAANACLQPFLAEKQAAMQKCHAQIVARSRAEAVLLSREYAFCLHPQKRLSHLLLESFETIA